MEAGDVRLKPGTIEPFGDFCQVTLATSDPEFAHQEKHGTGTHAAGAPEFIFVVDDSA